jgi:hypothetical protein
MAVIQVKVPDWLDRICVWPTLAYRRWKYGYSFRRIFIGEGKSSIVEPGDFYRVNNFHWSVKKNGPRIYAVRMDISGKKTKIISMQRELMSPPANLLVDHRNRDSLDNRRANLRLATRSQNMFNRAKRKSKTSSRFIGVSFNKAGGKWTARIYYQNKQIWLGRFGSELDAANAYDEAARKYHKEFACLNFPES